MKRKKIKLRIKKETNRKVGRKDEGKKWIKKETKRKIE